VKFKIWAKVYFQFYEKDSVPFKLLTVAQRLLSLVLKYKSLRLKICWVVFIKALYELLF